MSNDNLENKISQIIKRLDDLEKRVADLEKRISISSTTILSEIVFNKKEQINKLLNALKSTIKLDEESGQIYIKNITQYTDSQKILIYLAGKMLLHSISNKFDECANLNEIVNRLSLKKNVAKVRISELYKRHLLLKEERGVYKINYVFIDEIINVIMKK